MSEHSRRNILGCEEDETVLQEVGSPSYAPDIRIVHFSMDEIHQIREIRVLKQLNGHPNIVFLREIIL